MMNIIRALGISIILSGSGIAHADEIRSVLFQSLPESPLLLQPGDSIQAVINITEQNSPASKMLRVIGGVQMPGNFHSRGETNFRRWEYFIDDHLDPVHVVNDRYSLLFRGSSDRFDRKAFHRISGEYFEGGELEISLQVRRRDFRIHDNGKFGIEVELFYKKEGRNENDIYDQPDARLWMPVPSADRDSGFTEIKETFELPDKVAAAVIVAGGNCFSGDCLMEAPVLKQQGKQIIAIPFVPHEQRSSEFSYWTGVNLVSRNWPVWKVTLDGAVVFHGPVFDRASDIADFYIPLPEDVKTGSNLTLTLQDIPGTASFPYELRGLEIIGQPAGELVIVSQPRFVTAGKRFGVLVETDYPGTRIAVEATSGIEPVSKEIVLGEKGLHVISFNALRPGSDQEIRLQVNGKNMTINVGQILKKNDDHVFLSNGDDIYVDMAEPHYAHYFKWYVHNRIGNFFQFRPSYQWSGRRFSDSLLVRKYLHLLVGLDMPYAWQVEGRTMAGEHLNPPLEALSSPLFHGKQAHENDGGYYYWRHFHYEGQVSDMAARARPYGGIFAKQRPIYTARGTFIHYDPYRVKDMEDGAKYFVRNLGYSKGESTRHTGPSAMFRYLYQAGYDWLGAEQMYGPEETIMSSLRGASRAYNKINYGSLHAMQWGSGPYTDPRHAHRFYLSLATAYMHGSSHMNTEDALWIDEYANDRFSASGKQHIAVQHKILDFIQTHERRGRQVNDIAIIQGRNCAWKSFGRGPLWSQLGNEWEFNKATESFDLVKIFYPQNTMNSSGPEGWFTSMPYGAIDLLPVEAGREVLDQYKVIIFLGWNTYDRHDWERMAGFVRDGGTLLLSAAHLNEELQPHLLPRFPVNDKPVRQMLGKNYRLYNGKIEIPYGKGRVIYFPAPVYPADVTIRDSYIAAVKSEAEKVVKEQWGKGWITPDHKTSFTVWDAGNRRTIYLLNIDWSTPQNKSSAELHLGDYSFNVLCRSYELEVVHIAEGLAIIPGSNTTDILSVGTTGEGWLVEVQTTGEDGLIWYNGINGHKGEEIINEPGIHTIAIGRNK